MAESKRRENSPMETVPIDVLFNILIRLPVKCLLLFKSVCKSWYALITSREFADHHFRRNSLSSDRLLIFSGEDNSLYSVNLESPESSPAVKIPFPSIAERFSRKNIVGSCNGLLLCVCDETPNFEALLINSSSLPCKRIPKLKVPLNCLYVNYGLGYDCGVGDYKVVRIVHFLWGATVAREAMEVMVYSLRTDSWKLVKQNFLDYGTPKSKDGALVNSNLLHWLFWSYTLNDHRIAGFDVCSEEWSEVPMLEYFEGNDSRVDSRKHDRVDMGVLDGCLCLVISDYGNFHGQNVWVMKEYGVKDSWVKLFDFTDICLIGSLHIAPITYSKEGDEILLRRDQLSRVFWFNLSEKTVREAEMRSVPDYRRVGTCIRTLIPPSANGQIGDEIWPRSGKDGLC
uniref:F-box domain-containing protein n=1 Tax=Opuntia streptacantha TaxID=393608 RepID=A0A7C8ZS77_OPUST